MLEINTHCPQRNIVPYSEDRCGLSGDRYRTQLVVGNNVRFWCFISDEVRDKDGGINQCNQPRHRRCSGLPGSRPTSRSAAMSSPAPNHCCKLSVSFNRKGVLRWCRSRTSFSPGQSSRSASAVCTPIGIQVPSSGELSRHTVTAPRASS